MKKIIILSSVLLLIIAAIAAKYFSELSDNSGSSTKILNYIPSDAALIMSFNNEESFYDIFKNYEPFDAITGEIRAAELGQIRTILLKPLQPTETAEGGKIFISFHPGKKDSVDLLFSVSLAKGTGIGQLEEALHNLQDAAVAKDSLTSVYTITLKTINKPFFLFLAKGVAAGSFSKELLVRAVDLKTPRLRREFISEINESDAKDQNSPVSLFMDHTSLPAFLRNFMRGKETGNTLLLKGLKGFSSLSMNFKSDALMFNGISTPDTAAVSAYLNLFLDQKAVKNQLKTIIPAGTANFILFGLSDYKKFHQHLRYHFNQQNMLKKLEYQINLIHTGNGVDLHADLQPWFADEFTVIEASSREKMAIVKLSDGQSANFTLQLISQKVSETVSRLNHSNILYYYLGDPFKEFTRPYFAVTDNYLIIANSAGTVQRYLDDYNNERFLARSKDFTEHDQLVSSQSNILYFTAIPNSESIIRSVLKRGYAKAFDDDNYGLKNFYGLSVQWSGAGRHFQTNLYANYHPGGVKELKTAWTYDLNARLATAPQVFDNGDRRIILVQDYVNNLYALSDEGKRIWAVQLDGRIKGPLHQLNDSSLVFNTGTKLYRMDMKGYNLSGFPVNLPFNASYGLTLSSSDTTSVRIFVPAGRMILSYDGTGKTVTGWNKELPGKIRYDLKTAVVSNTSYLVAATDNGNFLFYNHNGLLIGKASLPGNNSISDNPLAVNAGSDAAELQVIATDTSGTACYISPDGKISTVTTGSWSPSHRFAYCNVAGDEKPELIYLDQNQLNVFHHEGALAFTYQFERLGESGLQLFPLNKDEYQIGISAEEGNQLFLFDDGGNLLKGFPVKGTGEFYVGYLKNDGIRYLICSGGGNSLYAYKL